MISNSYKNGLKFMVVVSGVSGSILAPMNTDAQRSTSSAGKAKKRESWGRD